MQDTIAVALVAVGGTVSSAVLSYFGTRHTTSTQLSASSEATDVQLESVRLEIRKLEEGQAAELRNSRQRLYQDYLAAAYSLRDHLAGALDFDLEAISSCRKALRDREIEIELLASPNVKAHTEPLFDLLTGVIDQVYRSTPSYDANVIAGLLTEAFERAPWIEARDALLKAMSEELMPVSPGDSST